MNDDTWRDQAACTAADPQIFCPPKLPTKHELQREKQRAARELRRLQATGPGELTDTERAALAAVHADQHDRWIRARLICARCPVQPECLDYALANEPDEHFWGGMSGIERYLHRRRQNTRASTTSVAS